MWTNVALLQLLAALSMPARPHRGGWASYRRLAERSMERFERASRPALEAVARRVATYATDKPLPPPVMLAVGSLLSIGHRDGAGSPAAERPAVAATSRVAVASPASPLAPKAAVPAPAVSAPPKAVPATPSNNPAGAPTVRGVFDKTMLRLPEVIPSINQVWASEPRDFTPWLAEHLELLDVLGLGRLELVEQEKPVPGAAKALDVLAVRATGELVAVENQFSALDHDHLTRGLAYAVGLQAPILVLIAEDHRGEFRAVARYLNELAARSDAPYRVGVYLVKIGIERIENYLIPRVSVVESPNPLAPLPELAAGAGPAEAGLEEFLSQVSTSAVQAASELCRWWQSLGGTLRFSRQSVSLDRPHPTKPEPLSYVVLYTSGSCWLNRGYLTESGAVPAQRVDEFDAVVADALPSLRRGENGYYLVAPSPIPVSGLQPVIGWIDRFASGR